MGILISALLFSRIFSQAAFADPVYSLDCLAEKSKAEAAMRGLLGSDTHANTETTYRSSTASFHRSVIACYGLKYQAVENSLSNYDHTNSVLFLALTLLDERLLPQGIRNSARGNNAFSLKLTRDIHFKDIISNEKNGPTALMQRSTYSWFGKRIPPYLAFVPEQLVNTSTAPDSIPRDFAFGSTIPYGIYIALHEYAHSIDHALSDDSWWESPFYSEGAKALLYEQELPAWKTIIHQAEKPSLYASNSIPDEFAEHFTAYLLIPSYRCSNPKQYAFFAKYFPVNTHVYGDTRPFPWRKCLGEVRP